MRAAFVDELADLFPDSDPPPRSERKWRSDTARGGIAGVHVMVHGLNADQPLQVSVKRGARSALEVALSRLVDVPVEHNTGLAGGTGTDNPHVIRKAPFRIFDAIEPLPGMTVMPQGTVTVLRLERPVTTGDSADAKSYTVTLTQGAVERVLEWTVTVHPIRLPATGRDSFPFTNWFRLPNMASYHDAVLWSPKHWRLIARYAQLMARARQNTFILDADCILDKQADGSYLLNRKRLERLVSIFEKAGLYYIEGPHLGIRTGHAWESPTLSIMSAKGPTVGSPEGHALLANLCRQLMEAIDANGWRGRWLQHCADEPIASHAADYRLLVGITHKYMPGIPVLDAVMNTGLAGSVNIWCPLAHEYERDREAFDSMRAFGDRIWYYTCLQPGGNFLNRTMDMERIRPALIAWGAALYGMDGFLHWGLNSWVYHDDDQTGIDPFTETCKRHGSPGADYLPPGDTHVVYPGPEGPWSSTRLEAHRVGMEDYELIKLLRKKDAARADKILKSVIRSFTDYTKDTRVYRRARLALFAALDNRSRARAQHPNGVPFKSQG